MWCSTCQQDVPAVARSSSDARATCARCGQLLRRPGAQVSATLGDLAGSALDRVPTVDGDRDSVPPLEFLALDDWDFEEVLSEADRVVRAVRRQHAPWLTEPARSRRVEAGHPASSPVSVRPSRTAVAHRAPPRRNHSVSWAVLTLGLAVFVCGAVLLGMASVQDRPDLWQVGLPLVLGGQVAVLAVVIGQMEAIWQSNRATSVALQTLDRRMDELPTSKEPSPQGARMPAGTTADRSHRQERPPHFAAGATSARRTQTH